MIAELAAAASAACWGTADYCGGRASRRAAAPAVVAVSQLVSLPLLAVGLAAAPAGRLTGPALGWGFAAGAMGTAGLVLLYRALAAGAMSVAAPVTAVTAALIPLVAGLVTDRPPGGLGLLGAGCAVLAIGLVSLVPRDGPAPPRLVATALLAGSAFGAFFILLDRAPADAGLWPLAGMRSASLVLAGALTVRTVGRCGLAAVPLPWAVGAGSFDIGANGLYLVAAYTGLLTVVAPIASLYPASTVALAFAVDRERLGPVQVAGLGLAGTALVLVNL